MSAARPALGRYAWATMGFAWLILLAIPAGSLASGGSPRVIAGEALGLVGFMVVYGWFWLRVRPWAAARGGELALIALTTFATLLVLADPGRWWPLPAYLAAVAGALSPPRRAAIGVAGVALIVVALGWINGQDALSVAESAVGLAVLGVVVLATTELISTNVQLRAARAEIGRLAVSDERLRFARDLHDVLGQSLSLIVLKAGLSVRLAEAGDERAHAEMADVEQVALDALQQVRDVVVAYRQPSLDDELRASSRLLEAAGIRCVLHGTVEAAPPAVDTALGWAVREGVTNVVRHSGARCCTIAVQRQPDAVRLEIADDGRSAAAAIGAEGNGLRGLRERLVALSGELTARSSPAGFVLTVTIPLDSAAVSAR
ncbi:MAG TPA: sensor histidine kinase [Terriglobales bacterium]|nr:sensor histidine kinase [Terriglobales bacterium]